MPPTLESQRTARPLQPVKEPLSSGRANAWIQRQPRFSLAHRLSPMLLLTWLALATSAHGEFTYVSEAGGIIITGYAGAEDTIGLGVNTAVFSIVSAVLFAATSVSQLGAPGGAEPEPPPRRLRPGNRPLPSANRCSSRSA